MVNVQFGHEYIGDVNIFLIHVASQHMVKLTPGDWNPGNLPPSQSPYMQNDASNCDGYPGVNYTLTAHTTVEPQCLHGQNDTGTYAPAEKFTPMIGLSTASAWTLSISDRYPNSTGNFFQWSLFLQPGAVRSLSSLLARIC